MVLAGRVLKKRERSEQDEPVAAHQLDGRRGARRVWLLVVGIAAAAAASHLLLLDDVVLPSLTEAVPWFVVVGIAAAAAASHLLLLDDVVLPSLTEAVPWFVVAAMFAGAELSAVHIFFKREAYSPSMTEVPLLVGLVALTPHALVLAGIVGVSAELALRRRQPLIKLSFNLAMVWLETVLVIVVYAALLGPHDPISVRGWLAAFAAMLIHEAIDSVLVPLAASLYEGRIQRAMAGWVAGAGLVAVVANTSLGLLTVVALALHPASLLLVLVVIAVTVAAYRAYGDWRHKHDSLRQLYELTRGLRPGSLHEAVEQLLECARDLLRTEAAELVLRTGAKTSQRFSLDAEGLVLPGQHDAQRPRRLEDGSSLSAELHGKDRLLGALTVRDRIGYVGSFTVDDERLLETLANHVAVMVENHQLIDRLRGEVSKREHQALHDSLTGLPNRTLFHERMTEAIGDRPVGTMLGVLLLDFDRFKEVNDTLGHHIGDHLLQKVGTLLRASLAPGELIARLGGDEFAVLVSGVEDATQLVAVAERLREVLAHPVQVGPLRLEIEASIGIAMCPEHGEDSSTLLRRADVAMYAAKAKRSGIEFYAPEHDENSPRRLVLAGGLREAIDRAQLLVHYQPKAELATGAVTAAEALVRWHHPDYGFIPPDEFIPMAEHAGMVGPLTRYVLERVLIERSMWQERGHDLEIAVNLSTWSLLDLQFPEDLQSLLDAYEVPANRLRLEITESSMLSDPHRTGSVLDALSSMGIGLSVDDFGTGYSSLSWLRRLPVDEVKIDRSFVSSMLVDESDAAIVRSTIDLARNLGLRVVAEGVEDPQTWGRLRALDCDFAQGYLLSRPVTAPLLLRWLDDYTANPPAHVAAASLAPPRRMRPER